MRAHACIHARAGLGRGSRRRRREFARGGHVSAGGGGGNASEARVSRGSVLSGEVALPGSPDRTVSSERDRGTGCCVRGAAGLRRDRRRSGNVSGFGMPGAASCPQSAGPGDPALMAATSVPGRSGQGGLGLRSAEHRPRSWMRRKKKKKNGSTWTPGSYLLPAAGAPEAK